MSEKKAKEARKVTKEDGRPTNGELLAAMESLAKLVAIDFHVSDSLKVRKLKQQMLTSYTLISEVKNDLVKKYGEELTPGSGNFVIIAPNDPKGRPASKRYPEFAEEYVALLLPLADIKFDKIKLPSQIDGNPIVLSSNDLERLDKFVEIV